MLVANETRGECSQGEEKAISRPDLSYRYKHQRTLNTSCDKSRSVKLPTQKRIDSIDLFKGIAILGIVWKHTFHPQWCDLIHISALFFILSGIFFKDEPFIPFLKKKIRTILIPFLFFYILSYLARMAFYFGHFRTLHGFAWDSLLEIFSISNTPDYLTVNIPLWFLVGLFVMQIIFWCLNRVIPRNKYRSCWFLVILAALYAGYGTIESGTHRLCSISPSSVSPILLLETFSDYK